MKVEEEEKIVQCLQACAHCNLRLSDQSGICCGFLLLQPSLLVVLHDVQADALLLTTAVKSHYLRFGSSLPVSLNQFDLFPLPSQNCYSLLFWFSAPFHCESSDIKSCACSNHVRISTLCCHWLFKPQISSKNTSYFCLIS